MNVLRNTHQSNARGIGTALLGWAAVVATALLAFFVHVLHEQMDRGAAMRAQFGLDVPSVARARPLRTASASELRRADKQR